MERSSTKRRSSHQVIALMLFATAMAWFSRIAGDIPLYERAFRSILAILGIAAGVMLWRGDRRGSTVLLVWSVLVASKVVYPPAYNDDLLTSVLVAVLVLTILAVVNYGVHRDFSQGNQSKAQH